MKDSVDLCTVRFAGGVDRVVICLSCRRSRQRKKRRECGDRSSHEYKIIIPLPRSIEMRPGPQSRAAPKSMRDQA
jgi:hypothetical protein